MAEITKQALTVENNQSFPNNNNGQITPDDLRTFNQNMIDSLVDEITYNADSASWNAQIDNISTGSVMVTGSVDNNILTFVKGNGSTFSLAVTASVGSVDWDNVLDKPSGLVSGSSQILGGSGILSSSVVTFNSFSSSVDAEFNAIGLTTQSLNNSITQLNSFTSSQETKNSTLATYTGSVDTKFSTIGGQSGSWDNTSLNAFTASQQQINTALNASTASQQVSIDALNSFTSSQEVLNAKFATTGSNTFVGNQIINGNINANTGSFNLVTALTASFGQINYVTGSAVIVGDAFIVLNTDTPTLRYAGLQVIDSGSGGTSSLQWDGDTDTWLVVEESGQSAYLLSGPTGSLGSEVTLTDNRIPKSGTGNQLVNSSISDNGTIVSIGANLSVTGSIQSNGTSVLLDGALSQLNSFTSSQEVLNAKFATTSSNVFTSGQTIINGGGIDLQANVEGSGSAFVSITSRVDIDSDPTNVYSGIQLVKPNGDALLNLAVNSYSPQYGGVATPMILADGNNPAGNNTAIGFTSDGGMDIWKKTNFKYGVDITGSANVNGSSVVTSNQTGSLVNIPLTSLNAFTASQQGLNSSFATTGSNNFYGNQTINGSSTLNVGGAIVGNNGLSLESNGASIEIRSNSNGSGSAYTGLNAKVDNTTDPTNVYASLQLIDDATNATLALAWNSYTPYYSTSTPMIVANQYYSGSDVAFAFPTNVIDVWKPLNVKSGAGVTGSLSVSGSINTSVIPLAINSNTASLNASTGNTFQLNLVSGSATRLEISGTKSGQTINLLVSQSASGPGTLVFGAGIEQPSGSFYSASQVANGEDILTMATFINPSKIYVANVKNFI